MSQEIEVVIIVGAGPAGLATSACLNSLSIPNIILERESCSASLWKKRSYDRLKLHLAKQFCQLPHMPFPSGTPTFVSKSGFINYLDTYTSHFNINPLYNRSVESASYDGFSQKWRLVVKNLVSGVVEGYFGKFLVVASGENSEGFIPKVCGLDSFIGEFIHSSEYENGKRFRNKDVLVVGCGNSGMEIAYDLSNFGARAVSIVARNPVHVLTKEMVQLGMFLLKLFPCNYVDILMTMLVKLKHGDLSEYGIQTPTKGPFYLKRATGQSPVIDVGTIDKIKNGEIQVLPSITSIRASNVQFSNGKTKHFDAIVFATGYRSTVRKWLQDGEDLLTEHGMPKRKFPEHWKGENGLYSAGFGSSGLFGISNDAQSIANDINLILGRPTN